MSFPRVRAFVIGDGGGGSIVVVFLEASWRIYRGNS